jgi:hypothetical protein
VHCSRFGLIVNFNLRAWKIAQGQLRRDLYAMAKRMPDPSLTEDRDAVAAAVRGASVNRVPEERAAFYGRMSNTDFRKDVVARYGFDPASDE